MLFLQEVIEKGIKFELINIQWFITACIQMRYVDCRIYT